MCALSLKVVAQIPKYNKKTMLLHYGSLLGGHLENFINGDTKRIYYPSLKVVTSIISTRLHKHILFITPQFDINPDDVMVTKVSPILFSCCEIAAFV